VAGYSPKSLAQKLGIQEGVKALLVQAPPEFEETLGARPGVSFFRADTLARARSKALAKAAPFGFIHCFCRTDEDLRAWFPLVKALLAFDGMIWISWEKKRPGFMPNLGENRVREIGLEIGLVDVKVCAVDETWSGLKFVYRLKDRPK
jgi:hypothetical protein